MPYQIQTRLPAAATFGALPGLVDALEAIAFRDIFIADESLSDGALVSSWAAAGGTIGTGVFTASGGDRPAKQTRDGLAVLRSDGSKVMLYGTGTLPTTGATVAVRFRHIRDVATTARFVLGHAGSTPKSLTAQTTITSGVDRQFYRFTHGPTTPDDILDSKDALDPADQWVSAVMSWTTSRRVITVETECQHPITRIAEDTYTTPFDNLYLFARSATPEANGFVGDIRTVMVREGDVHANAGNLRTTLAALKV